jgi:SAM-dependent methyltransferase
MTNINEEYFNGYYKDIWKSAIPNELTQKEVEFIIQYFNLNESSRVLDLMSGYGRHTIALAEKGITVVAVDNLKEYTDEINNVSIQKNLPVSTFTEKILDFDPPGDFDLIICMGNSLSLFNEQETLKIFSTASNHLKSGRSFFINCWTIAEIVFRNFQERSWAQIGDLKYLTESKLLFHPTRIETQHNIITPDSKEEIKSCVDYIFSISELENLLNISGLKCEKIYSIPGRKDFKLGEPRAYIIATKL